MEADVTIRQELMEVLAEGPCTVRDLSQAVGIPEREVLEHLPHIARSAPRQGQYLEVHPARCLSCGFIFRERKKLSRPSRCPKCRSERLSQPEYELR